MVSVFVVLIFVPAIEHTSENLSRACWRPFWVESSSRLQDHQQIVQPTLYSAITDVYSATRLTFLNYSIHINKEQNR